MGNGIDTDQVVLRQEDERAVVIRRRGVAGITTLLLEVCAGSLFGRIAGVV
jgi:hypothetical protein